MTNTPVGDLNAFREYGRGMWTGMQQIARELRDAGKNDLERESAVRNLLTRYTFFYDGDDVDGLAELFHRDCIVTNPRGTYQGRDAIMANYRYLVSERQVCLHYLSNTLVVIDSDDSARCGSFWYAVEVDHDGNSWGTGGTYLDKVSRTDKDGWQFAARRITHNFSHALPPAEGRSTKQPPASSVPENAADWTQGL